VIIGIIAWIILGLVAGFIASKVVNKHGKGVIKDVLLGIVGALLGGFVMHLIVGKGITGFNPWSLVVATGGAIVLLLAYHAVERRRHPVTP
jgi:uncharacterized membrane protein YeaQ/YmgE (transglycosylase-associated protein family)